MLAAAAVAVRNVLGRQHDRGYGRLSLDYVTQANAGCDFDFLSE
jgi:hypothetical protein